MRDIIQMYNDFYVFLIGLSRQTTSCDCFRFVLTKIDKFFTIFGWNIRYTVVQLMTIFAVRCHWLMNLNVSFLQNPYNYFLPFVCAGEIVPNLIINHLREWDLLIFVRFIHTFASRNFKQRFNRFSVNPTLITRPAG